MIFEVFNVLFGLSLGDFFLDSLFDEGGVRLVGIYMDCLFIFDSWAWRL